MTDLEQIAARYGDEARLQWSTLAQRKQAAKGAAAALKAASRACLELQRCGGGHLLTDKEGLPLLSVDALMTAADQCDKTASRLPDVAMRGKTTDVARQHLVRRLHRLYRKQTGKSHRYTHDRDGDGYHGPFIDFAVAEAARMGIDLTPKQIAGVLSQTPNSPK